MLEAALPPLAVIFIAGMAGSFHCIGMCGGFACALGRAATGGRAATALRHVLYNSGRVVSYVFLGALAGMLGASTLGSGADSFAAVAQRTLAVLAGLLMILMGAQLLGYLQHRHTVPNSIITTPLAGALRGVLQTPGHAAPLAFGVFNGFLPCPLVYAFVALAAAAADPLRGALVMAVFGLGTFPAMLASAGMGTWLRGHWRLHGVRLAGLFILLLGTLTLARGVLPLHGHGAHTLPSPGAASEQVLMADTEAPAHSTTGQLADTGTPPRASANLEAPPSPHGRGHPR